MKFLKNILIVLLGGFPISGFAQFSYDMQGHRGARGLMPENTIPAMIKALELGSTRLEVDLAISKDGEVIVSHEPYMNPLICWDPEGAEILSDDKSHNIYQMTYQEIQTYDCGSKIHPGFPQQVKFHVTKPRLKDVFAVVDQYADNFGYLKPNYNIEIKSSPEGDGVYHPEVGEFSEIVLKLIQETIGLERVNIQSFDFRVLQYLHKKHPDVELAMLVSNAAEYEKQLEELGFQPEIYSPHFSALSKEAVQVLHERGMKIVPWTVNTAEQMNALLDMGVDGIITDYPNLAPKR
ncbi:glycerophosphodiester phosphodiesterase family protein [Algoriphagus sp. CAU 1675]|nr:glycerophosphodiester phosphodiesterase family protein [Algoriphagus sp. CAU 1675]